jgi:hypothetical protein
MQGFAKFHKISFVVWLQILHVCDGAQQLVFEILLRICDILESLASTAACTMHSCAHRLYKIFGVS